MNAPKNWDGVTQIGSALVRGLQSLDTPVGTSFGQELRDNGSLGDVTAKKVLGFSSTHRSHEDPTPEGFPFLSSWQASSVFLLDEKLPYQKRVFNIANAVGLEVIGNCHFLGDGFSVGTARTATASFPDTTFGGPDIVMSQHIEVLLMRLPRPGAAVPAEDYLKASATERKKLSVRIPLESFAEHLAEVYTIPLGWKNETARYAFAVVVRMDNNPFLGSLPRMWVGDTGTMTMVETSLPLPADWDWYDTRADALVWASYKSQVFCTAPGQLEMVLSRSDRRRLLSYSVLAWMTYPTTYWLAPNPSTFLHSVGTAYILIGAAEDLRNDVFILRSIDFGATWTIEHAEAFQNGRLTMWPDRHAFGIGPSGVIHFERYARYVPLRQSFYDAAYPTYVEVTDPAVDPYIAYPAGRWWWDQTQATVIPVYGVSRGQERAAPGQLATLVGAGTVTFALVPGYTPIEAAPASAAGTFGYSPASPSTVFRMYRRVGAGAFEQISWPGEAFSLTGWGPFEVNPPGPIQPIAWIGSIHEQWRPPDDRANPYTNAWASTGEGRAAFFFASGFTFAGGATMDNNMPITMIATADGGATWVTRTILNSLNFRESCVLAADERGPVAKRRGATILYVEIDTTPGPTFGQRQLMRISEDFTTTAKYGRPYPVPPRAGIINFQRYVHPGFPGVYDGPDAQPPAAS